MNISVPVQRSRNQRTAEHIHHPQYQKVWNIQEMRYIDRKQGDRLQLL